MLSLPLTSIDIISRRFVNTCDQALSLIFRTYVETSIWAETGMEGGGGAGAPDLSLENYKSFISKKKNWYELPSKSNPFPPPLPVGVVWIRTRMSGLTVEFYFLSSRYRFNYYTSANAQADLRLCCLHATKSSLSQQGTNGMR